MANKRTRTFFAAPMVPVVCNTRLPNSPQRKHSIYIGAVARQTDASVKAIRLYERMGLMGTVERIGRYRVYTERHIAQVRLIKQAQAMGLSLADMATAIRPGQHQPDWRIVAAQVKQRRVVIALEITRLTSMDRVLKDIEVELRSCDSGT